MTIEAVWLGKAARLEFSHWFAARGLSEDLCTNPCPSSLGSFPPPWK